MKQDAPVHQNSSNNENTEFASISDLISVLSGPIPPLEDMMVAEIKQSKSTETNVDTPVNTPVNTPPNVPVSDTNNFDLSNKEMFDLINEVIQRPVPQIPDNTFGVNISNPSGNVPMTNELNVNYAQYAYGNLNYTHFFPFSSSSFDGTFAYANPSIANHNNQHLIGTNYANWGNLQAFNPVYANSAVFMLPQYAGSYDIHQGNPSFAAGTEWTPAMGSQMFDPNSQQGNGWYRGVDGHYYSQ